MVDKDVKKLKMFFEKQEEKQEIVKYSIIEKFNNKQNEPYIIHNIDVETEGDYIMFYDIEKIIQYSGNNILKMFLLGSANLKISRNIINIVFTSGDIRIKIVS